ncbi:MAG TPA: DUF58 domain-containing protein [Burkholderiales bacterium]|nr:DUF58 domain-containing protein [Burkholderiales bacterium]
MRRALQNFLNRWLFKLNGPEAGPIVLTQRRVFILPTRQGLLFGILLLLLLIGSINYSLGLGYVLTFLLAAMGNISMLHAFRNLAGMQVRPGKADPVFAGEWARFAVCLDNRRVLARYAIAVTRGKQAPVFCDVLQNAAAIAEVGVPAPRRGWLRPGRITLFTRFPLGLFRAWSYVELDAHCLVYPRPDAATLPPVKPHSHSGAGVESGRGNDDFTGLRPHQPSDSPRHIAWKAAARDYGLLTKQFVGRADMELWLDWNDLPSTLDDEAKLSRLCRWVLDAETAGISYGLRLPGKELPLAYGEQHRQSCLEALALFGLPETEHGKTN